MKYANEFLEALRDQLIFVSTWHIPLHIDGREVDRVELKGDNDMHDLRIEITTKQIKK